MDPQLQSAFATGYERLSAWSDLLDQINVFPVADADTGSNLMISLAPLHRMDVSPDVTVKRLLVSALGNSGNIASGFFTGFIAEDPAKDMHQAAKAGRARAWQALADPKPGTMLTVFDELLDYLAEVPRDRLAATYPALIEKLQKAVHTTAETLPAMKAAGVVDAGALGIFLFMEGFFGSLAGGVESFRPVTETFREKLKLAADFAPKDPKGYCVDTVVQVGEGFDSAVAALAKFGESVVVLREDDRIKIHLHTESREDLRRQLEDFGRVVQWSEQDMALQAANLQAPVKRSAVHVISDAAGSVTRQDAVRLGMTLLDSYIIVGDKSLPETLFSPAELYALMRQGVRVKTAQASVFERHQRYQSTLSRFDSALYLCVGSVFTGNFQAASAWREKNDPEGRLKIVDTGLASGRLGIVALATARYASETHRAEKVVQFAEAAIRACQEYIFLDQLKYLVAGGRLSKTKGFFGDLLHMKPIITPTAEGVVKAGTTRNPKEQIAFALEKLVKGLGPDAGALVMLEYTDNRQWVEENVLGLIRGRFPAAEVIFQPLSLTSGVHMGPGTWGVAFLPKLPDFQGS
jgi:hypothetical protein